MNLTKRDKTPRSKKRVPAEILNAKQVLALSQLLQGQAMAEVARQLGVDRSTLWRWLKLPQFAGALADLQTDLTSEARSRLKRLSTDAVEVPAELLDCEDPRVRLAAANSILERAGVDGAPGPDERDRVWSLAFAATSWE